MIRGKLKENAPKTGNKSCHAGHRSQVTRKVISSDITGTQEVVSQG